MRISVNTYAARDRDYFTKLLSVLRLWFKTICISGGDDKLPRRTEVFAGLSGVTDIARNS